VALLVAVAEEQCSAISGHRKQTGMITSYMAHLLLEFLWRGK
jgi:hypothetical protein